MVLPLSTKTSPDCSSNFQCCFIIVIAFSLSHHATHSLLTRLPCEQFSSAKNLRFHFERTTPACGLCCTTLSYDCGIKHLSHDAEADFAFSISVMIYVTGFEPATDSLIDYCSTNELNVKFANLPRSATSAASFPFGKQNTTLRLFFSLRDTKPYFRTFALDIAT